MKCETCGGGGWGLVEGMCPDCHGTGEKEKTMTRDEALKRALRGSLHWANDLIQSHEGNATSDQIEQWSVEGFLASLKASGWTLARVKPTEKMIMAAYKIDPTACDFDEEDARVVYPKVYYAMLAAQDENDEG
jgi:hypothetical protein